MLKKQETKSKNSKSSNSSIISHLPPVFPKLILNQYQVTLMSPYSINIDWRTSKWKCVDTPFSLPIKDGLRACIVLELCTPKEMKISDLEPVLVV